MSLNLLNQTAMHARVSKDAPGVKNLDGASFFFPRAEGGVRKSLFLGGRKW